MWSKICFKFKDFFPESPCCLRHTSQRALAVSGIHHYCSWPKNFCSKKEKRTFYSWMSCESNFQKKNKEEKKKNSVWSISHKMWCHRPFIKSKCSKTAQQKVSYYRNYTLNTPSLIYFGELTDELLLYQLTKGSDVYIFYCHNLSATLKIHTELNFLYSTQKKEF